MRFLAGLAPAGYLYVPKVCEAQGARCKLHFSLHGCGVNEYYDDAVHHLGQYYCQKMQPCGCI
eukprot:COSAG06_NODE_5435_length_3483_cov_2.515071_1_plen_63_part_00